jgi:hypothetical protein
MGFVDGLLKEMNKSLPPGQQAIIIPGKGIQIIYGDNINTLSDQGNTLKNMWDNVNPTTKEVLIYSIGFIGILLVFDIVFKLL